MSPLKTMTVMRVPRAGGRAEEVTLTAMAADTGYSPQYHRKYFEKNPGGGYESRAYRYYPVKKTERR